MRRAIRQRVASFITPTAKCHPPFSPKRSGKYIVKKCYACGEVVLASDLFQGGLPFEIEVRDPKEKT